MKSKYYEYQKQWRLKNKDYLNEYSRKRYKKKHKEIREYANKYRKDNWLKIRQYEKDSRFKTPYSFLSYKFYNLKEKKHKVLITKEFLYKLWDRQNGKCAITGKQMLYYPNNLKTVSIDRIDSDIDYIEGNVQLVCAAINYAKNHFPNKDIIDFWNNRNESGFIDDNGKWVDWNGEN